MKPNLLMIFAPTVLGVAALATAQTQTQRYEINTVVRGLEHPWGMVWLPDGTMLVTERPGRLRVIRDGKLEAAPVIGVPQVFASGQGGLLDVSLHPQFAQNRLVYLTYAHGSNSENRTRMARGVFDGKALTNVRVLFEVTQSKTGGAHFGSRMTWLPDNTVLVSVGDGGNPPTQLEGDFIRKQAQNLQSRLGKIVRLRDDGTIPNDNPFARTANADPALWSIGHRNIQGMAYDPATRRVWATEHGARGGDELNLVRGGENHGWPLVTHSREYSGPAISNETSRSGMVDPKVVWTPSIAPSGLMIYNGDRFPAWKGNVFAGGLASADIRRMELNTAGDVTNQTTIRVGQRVRDVRQGPDGLIYLLTDQNDGQLLRISP
jgi:glucose/arabinose dehydrogenase